MLSFLLLHVLPIQQRTRQLALLVVSQMASEERASLLLASSKLSRASVLQLFIGEAWLAVIFATARAANMATWERLGVGTSNM